MPVRATLYLSKNANLEKLIAGRINRQLRNHHPEYHFQFSPTPRLRMCPRNRERIGRLGSSTADYLRDELRKTRRVTKLALEVHLDFVYYTRHRSP